MAKNNGNILPDLSQMAARLAALELENATLRQQQAKAGGEATIEYVPAHIAKNGKQAKAGLMLGGSAYCKLTKATAKALTVPAIMKAVLDYAKDNRA